MATQKINQETLAQLASYFQLLADPTISPAVGMALLRAGVGIDVLLQMNTKEMRNIVSNFVAATIWGNQPTLGRWGILPYASWDGSGWMHFGTRGLTGTETYIGASERGTTLLAIVRQSTLAAGQIVGTNGGSGNYEQWLELTSSGQIRYSLSNDGTTLITYTPTIGVITANQWSLIISRFDPSTEVEVRLNGASAKWTTSIPASAYAGTGYLGVMGNAAGNNLVGDMAAVACYHSRLSDELIGLIEQRWMPILGLL